MLAQSNGSQSDLADHASRQPNDERTFRLSDAHTHALVHDYITNILKINGKVLIRQKSAIHRACPA